jgi:hypothetical protein
MDQIKGKKKSRDIRSSGDGAGIKNQEEKDRRGGKKKKRESDPDGQSPDALGSAS